MTLRIAEPRLVQTRLGRVAVREYGSPGAPVAVLWHSMFVDSSSWSRVVPALREHRRLVVVDGPGYGDSDDLTSVTTMAECADAARELLDALDVPAADWVGNAWGGHVGYQLDADHPGRVRSLVAISSPPKPLPALERARVALLRPVLATLGPAPFLVDLVAEAQLTDFSRAADAESVSIIRNAMARQSRRSLSTTVASFVIGRRDLTRALARGSAPALFVASDDRGEWGPDDAAAAASLRSGATAITVSWARTLIPVEQPATLARRIIEFWQSRDRL